MRQGTFWGKPRDAQIRYQLCKGKIMLLYNIFYVLCGFIGGCVCGYYILCYVIKKGKEALIEEGKYAEVIYIEDKNLYAIHGQLLTISEKVKVVMSNKEHPDSVKYL